MIDEDLDPVEEIRAIRAKINRKYKTIDAYCEHLRTIPSADVLLAQIQAKIAKAKIKAAAKPAASRRKAAKRLAPA